MQDRSAKAIESYEKEGVFVGAQCINPLNGARMPIYTANFALMEYGTGAVMAVPAHDQRDFDFAKKYDLDIVVVVKPPDEDLDGTNISEAYTGDGIMVNSGEFDGLDGWGLGTPHRHAVRRATPAGRSRLQLPLP